MLSFQRPPSSVDLVDWQDWRALTLGEEPTEVEHTEFGTLPYRFYRAVEE